MPPLVPTKTDTANPGLSPPNTTSPVHLLLLAEAPHYSPDWYLTGSYHRRRGKDAVRLGQLRVFQDIYDLSKIFALKVVFQKRLKIADMLNYSWCNPATRSGTYHPYSNLNLFSLKSLKQVSTTTGSYSMPRFFEISSRAASMPGAGR